jgi:hypothetical protein
MHLDRLQTFAAGFLVQAGFLVLGMEAEFMLLRATRFS